MSPWDIIGWGILGILALGVGLFALSYGKCRAIRWWRYVRTRNIKPAEGQRWDQDGEILVIGKYRPSGSFTIRAGVASWSETGDEWMMRVRNRRLFLVDAE